MNNEIDFGKIHSYEHFSTLDGPGIRFVIFMQGCNLRCKYCHNPDTWDLEVGKKKSISEIISQIKKYKPYFTASGGGVTASGGEPLMQTNFLIELFKTLKDLNIHTTLDTSGSLKINDDIKKLLKYTDLVLLDIKHIDSDKCTKLTGLQNKNTLDFAKYLSDNNIKMWIRQVLVPSVTDNPDDLKTLKSFIDTLKTVEKIELLPYHDLGRFKWDNLNLDYPLKTTRPPTELEINKSKKILGI